MTAGTATLDISAHGFTDSGNLGRFCLDVDPARPDVVITDNVTGAPIPGFKPSFLPGEKYTVLIMRTPSGTFQFTTARNTTRPAPGNLGVRFFNGRTISYDIFMTDTVLFEALMPVLSNVQPGVVTDYVEVPQTTNSFLTTVAGTRTLAVILGANPFSAGATATFFVAPSTTGVVEDCTAASRMPAS